MKDFYSATPIASSGQTLIQKTYGFFNSQTRLVVLMICLVAGLSGSVEGQTTIQIGTGTGGPTVTSSPSGVNICSPYGGNVSSGAHGKKWQGIYTASMINTAMTNAGYSPGSSFIHAVGFNIQNRVTSSYSCTNYTVKMANVAQADLSGGVYTGAMTTVYAQNTTLNATGWFSLPIATPFQWDGTSNLCVEVCYTATYGFLIDSYGGCQWTAVGGNNHMVTIAGAATNCSTAYGGTQTNNLTNMRLSVTSATPCTGTPDEATAGSATVCAGTSTTLGLTGLAGASGYTYLWKESSSIGGPYTNASGTNNASTYDTPTSLPFNPTYYICEVTCSNSSEMTPSLPGTVSLNSFLNCYCIGDYAAATQGNRGISGVTLNGTPAISNTGTASSPEYSLFTAAAPVANAGLTVNQPYSLAVTVGSQTGTGSTNQRIMAWIDYDQDGLFEASEALTATNITVANANLTGTINFTVPPTAIAGTTRMRVRHRFGNSTLGTGDACTTFSGSNTAGGAGEIEDYNVLIISGCEAPDTGASASNVSPINTTSATLTWANGDGDAGRIVLLKQGSAVNASPLSDNSYTADAAFGNGDQIGTGNYVVYNSNGSSASITGLLPSTTYHYSIFEYNASGTCYVLSGHTGSFTTASCSPTLQASNFNFPCPEYSEMTMNFSRGDGSHVLVLAKAGSAVDGVPAYNESYTADANFGSGQQIGSGNYVVYNGSQAGMVSLALTGLSPNTTYHFRVYEYNASPNCYSTAPVTASQATRSAGTYTSSTVAQVTTNVNPWTVDQQVVSLAVVVGGGTDAATIMNSLTFNTAGSTSTTNISAAKIFYTGTSSTFSARTQFGSTVVNPSGSHTVTGSLRLAPAGTHYFWVAYDIIESPTLGNVVDATIPSFNLTDYTGTNDRTPTTTAPTGSRTIANPSAPSGYCTPSHNNSVGDCVSSVTFAGTPYTGATSCGNYVNNTAIAGPTVTPGSTYTLSFFADDFIGNTTSVWIDWDQSGTFASSGVEMVRLDGGTSSVSQNVTVPLTAVPGPTRMRILNRFPSAGSNACIGSNGSSTSGITLDFTVTVAGGSSGPPVICSTPAPTVTSLVNYYQGDTPSQLSATGTGLLWYTAATGGTGNATAPTPSTVAVGTTAYYVSSTYGCESTRTQISVYVAPEPCAPVIDTQPTASTIGCTVGVTSISVEATDATTYQWQISTNGGGTWSNLANGGKYSGVDTPTLSITNATLGMSGYQYQVIVSNENGSVTSTASTLSVQVCPSNDNPAPNNPNMSSINYYYPSSFFVAGSTEGATVSPSTGSADVWYQFNSISNGVRIVVNSAVIDPQIKLCNSSFVVVDTENAVSGTGTEIMNFGGLTEGQTYYVSVSSASPAQGAFNISVQQLRKAYCGTTGPYTLCTAFKSTVTGATSTTYDFTADAVTTSVTSSNPVTLSAPSLQLMYGNTYSVGMTATYALPGTGGTETIVVPNPTACTVAIEEHLPVDVRSNARCINGAVLYRTSYLQAQVIGAAICGVTGYRVEFTPVSNCNGDNPQNLETFSKTITSPAASISLNYAFNHIPLEGNSSIGYWLVRWKPRFGSLEGEYGNAHVVAVNGTAPSGMMLEQGQEQHGLSTTTNIAANLYPNPNNGEMVNLNMTGISTDNVHVRIMDGMGRVVYSNRYTVDGSLNTIVTFSKPLAAGLYMVEFTTGNEVITQRMMVSK